jgi:hypothetical protein
MQLKDSLECILRGGPIQIRFQKLNPEEFHDLCDHLLSAASEGSFRAINGAGGDSGIDGIDDSTGTLYQFHHPTSGPVTRRKLEADLHAASNHKIRRWVFIASKNLTIRTDDWFSKLKATSQYSFAIEYWGPAKLTDLLNCYPRVRDNFFPLPVTVNQRARQITNVRGDLNIRSGRARRSHTSPPPPPNAISDAQLKEIHDQVARIAEESGRRTTFGFVLRRVKAKWSLTSVRYLSQEKYPEVLDYLRRFKWKQREGESPASERIRLRKHVHAIAANQGWNHDRVSLICRQFYGCSLTSLSTNLLRDLVERIKEIET